MGWLDAGENRWRRDGDGRHVLLQAGGRYVEHEGGYVHVYDGPVQVDLDNPLGEAVWVSTTARPDLETATDGELWQALTADEYTKPAP